jgi:hypothetical protein
MALASNIDDEWSNFLSNNYANDQSSDDELINENCDKNDLEDTLQQNIGSKTIYTENDAPEPTNIYISTKSKIAYLDKPIDLRIFWDIPVIPYGLPVDGVVKKQIKINSKTTEEFNYIQNKLKDEIYYDQHIMSHIDNPNGRIKFKDIRKISIGISKKDIMSYRSKKKQAFYNCFVMIIRIKIEEIFREFHIKVFNTGKLEIPGVQNDKMFELVLTKILYILQPYSAETMSYKQTSDTVLINSNFNCGFYIDREILYDILKYNYNIQAIYDPCSYPGIQCKFYYNKNGGVQNGINIKTDNKEIIKNIIEVSFMIFRTGSVLIVGMCDENVLNDIYEFLKTLLKKEFVNICQKIITLDNLNNKHKNKKIRKKTIIVFKDPLVNINADNNEPNRDNIFTNMNDNTEEDIVINIDVVKKPRKKRNKPQLSSLKI